MKKLFWLLPLLALPALSAMAADTTPEPTNVVEDSSGHDNTGTTATHDQNDDKSGTETETHDSNHDNHSGGSHEGGHDGGGHDGGHDGGKGGGD